MYTGLTDSLWRGAERKELSLTLNGTAVTGALLSLTMAGFRYIRKSSYWLLVPYFLWVLFAGYLNLGIYLLNM